MSRLMLLKADAEVAIVVSRDLGGKIPSYSQCHGALANALPALELADWKLTLVDTVADDVSCGLYVRS